MASQLESESEQELDYECFLEWHPLGNEFLKKGNKQKAKVSKRSVKGSVVKTKINFNNLLLKQKDLSYFNFFLNKLEPYRKK